MLLGAGAIVRSISARAEQAALPLIGIIHSASAAANRYIVDAIRRGLKTADLVDGQNVAVEFHWAEGHYDRLSAMADDLVRRHAAVIFTGGGAAPARAAKAATQTIPIVFVSGDDPVQSGIVPSLSGTRHRPWLTALLARRPTMVATITLANKIARMAWAIMAKGERYENPPHSRRERDHIEDPV